MVSFYRAGEFVEADILEKMRQSRSKEEWQSVITQLSHENYLPYLYLVDAGLISSLPEIMMVNFIDLFQAITLFDGPLIAELMISRSKTPETAIDRDGFRASMSEFISTVKQKTLSFTTFSVSEILQFVFNRVREHHIKIEGEFVNVGIGLMLVEGVGSTLEPNMDLMQAAIPFLKEALKNRLHGPADTEINFRKSIQHQFRSLLWK